MRLIGLLMLCAAMVACAKQTPSPSAPPDATRAPADAASPGHRQWQAFEAMASRLPASSASPYDKDAFHLLVPPRPTPVADGYRYALWLDRRTARVWLLQSGGIAGTVKWLGPVAPDDRRVRAVMAMESDLAATP
jgi:hypothetical protein